MTSNSSNSSVLSLKSKCPVTPISRTLFTVYAFLNVLLLLPLCVFIALVAFQRWRRRRRSPASHSDVFTYHMSALNFLTTVGSVILFLEVEIGSTRLLMSLILVGYYLFSIILPGHMLMHCLTGLDLYLAVVHPVTYIRLKQTEGARIRNLVLVCMWLLLLGVVGGVEVGQMSIKLSGFFSVLVCVLFSLTLTAMWFFCLSVIYVLIHPRPGERGGASEKKDRSKQKALHIILVILAALFVECVPLLCTFLLYEMEETSANFTCVLLDCFMPLTLPGSLILPLLFVHRAGKLSCCRRSRQLSG